MQFERRNSFIFLRSAFEGRVTTGFEEEEEEEVAAVGLALPLPFPLPSVICTEEMPSFTSLTSILMSEVLTEVVVMGCEEVFRARLWW